MEIINYLMAASLALIAVFGYSSLRQLKEIKRIRERYQEMLADVTVTQERAAKVLDTGLAVKAKYMKKLETLENFERLRQR